MYRRNARDDAERLGQVLDGITYPAAKWQLIIYAEEYGADAATRTELWAVPAGSYADLAEVLAAITGAAAPMRLRPVAAGMPRPQPAPTVPVPLRPRH